MNNFEQGDEVLWERENFKTIFVGIDLVNYAIIEATDFGWSRESVRINDYPILQNYKNKKYTRFYRVNPRELKLIKKTQNPQKNGNIINLGTEYNFKQ